MEQTETRLTQITRRLKGTTQARWVIHAKRSDSLKHRLMPLDAAGNTRIALYGFIECAFEADAEYIVHSRDDMQFLLTEVQRLNAVLAAHGIQPILYQ